ncbi:amino acid permease [Hortaea werneckii]|nr:amino acid permease [Hortaea werneckii]
MEKDQPSILTSTPTSPIDKDVGSVLDADEMRLAEMGHKQELQRHFTKLSLVGLASTTTISWTGLGLGLTTEIAAGGPGAVIYGFILVFVLQCFLGASLAEFVSSYPTEGAMYHWIAAIAPRRVMGFLSFMTGYFTVFGWVFTTASTNLIYAQTLMALVALYHPGMTIQTWQTFVAYEGLNMITALVVLYGNKLIPSLNRFSLFYLQIGYFTVMVTVAACAPKHQSSEFVFRTWINTTGWENQVICFITGLVNPLYSLGGLDGVSHNGGNAKPIKERTAGSSDHSDWTALSNSNTQLPLAELFRQATSNAGGAFALTFLIFIAPGPCVVGSQLSTGRMFWAFSRDGALPFSEFWSKIHPSKRIPFNAQLAVYGIVGALGCLYLGSSTAFNSLMGTAVTVNNSAYMVPILTNLLTGRRNMHKGSFFMSGWEGFAVNTITVCWLSFAIVFFSFPYYKPVTARNMNYTCVVVGGLALLQLGWWFCVGKGYSLRMLKAKET